VARVLATADPPVTQIFSMAREITDLFDRNRDKPPQLLSVQAFCPNELVFGAYRRNSVDGQGRVWLAAPPALQAHPPAGADPEQILFGAYAPNGAGGLAVVNELDFGYPVDFIGAPPRFGVGYTNGADITLRGYDEVAPPTPWPMQVPYGTAAIAPNGDVLLGTTDGEVLFSPGR
jgi:hypothetical protein